MTRRVRDVGTLPPFCAVVALTAVVASPLRAQTDYYNTSAGRPMRIEDAVPVEYRAIELNITPLRWEIGRDASYRWTLEPEAAIGVLPRTQFQIGVPLTFIDQRATSARGATGLELSLMHALNAETSIPALAVAGDVLLPVGALAADAAYGTFKGIATRTFRAARIHANAQFTLGPTPPDSEIAEEESEASRWLAGLAVDKTFPLQSVLVSIETFAEQPLRREASLEWNAGVGARVQLTPRWAFDAGAGRRLTGNDQAWYMTLGSAYSLGVP